MAEFKCSREGCIRADNRIADRLCFKCCETCRSLNDYSRSVSHNDILLKIAINRLTTHDKEYHFGNKKTHTGNGVYQGAFAFTLTCSPADKLTKDDMIKAAKKLMKQKSIPVKHYAWFLEYRDKDAETGHHIHGMYETYGKGRIEAKHFMRAWPIWDEQVKLGQGFRGGYHRPVRSDEGYSLYIVKDGGECDFSIPE